MRSASQAPAYRRSSAKASSPPVLAGYAVTAPMAPGQDVGVASGIRCKSVDMVLYGWLSVQVKAPNAGAPASCAPTERKGRGQQVVNWVMHRPNWYLPASGRPCRRLAASPSELSHPAARARR
jgi:hypothetical protein